MATWTEADVRRARLYWRQAVEAMGDPTPIQYHPYESNRDGAGGGPWGSAKPQMAPPLPLVGYQERSPSKQTAEIWGENENTQALLVLLAVDVEDHGIRNRGIVTLGDEIHMVDGSHTQPGMGFVGGLTILTLVPPDHDVRLA